MLWQFIKHKEWLLINHNSIYEYIQMKHDMLYVSLTRRKQTSFVNFCNRKCYKPYVGYIYRYSYMGKSYTVATADIKKRWL